MAFNLYKKGLQRTLRTFCTSILHIKNMKNIYIYRRVGKSFKSFEVLFYTGVEMFIYGLANPANKEIFYVGKTNDLAKRFYQHMRGANGHNNKDLKSFIYQLKFKKLQPMLLTLEECSDDLVDSREKYWINYGFENNWPLTNWNFGKASKKAGGQAQIDYREWLNEKIEAI